MINARRSGIVLAVGLFALALWLAFRSPAGKHADGGEKKTPVEMAAVLPGPNGAEPGGQQAPSSIQSLTPGAAPEATAAVTQVGTTPPEARDAPVADPTDGGGGPAALRDAQIDAGKVRSMVRSFHTLTGENPVGTNAEIMQTLMGSNLRQARLGPPEGLLLNGKGELVDQWSTPYFFHQLSKDWMEIRSAGPDKTMWTADDVVVR